MRSNDPENQVTAPEAEGWPTFDYFGEDGPRNYHRKAEKIVRALLDRMGHRHYMLFKRAIELTCWACITRSSVRFPVNVEKSFQNHCLACYGKYVLPASRNPELN